MARLLLLGLHADHTTVAAEPLLLLFVVVVAAVVVSLCTSGKHAKLWRQRGTSASASAAAAPLVQADGAGAANRKLLLASLSGIGGKAARMVSWKRRSPSEGDGSGSSDDYDEAAAMGDEAAVWRKAIIMGEKCRPLEFSGHIAFDSDGNQLPIKNDAAAADVAKNGNQLPIKNDDAAAHVAKN